MKRIFYIEPREALEIIISVLAISFAFTILFAGLGSVFTAPFEFGLFMLTSVVTVGAGFVLHEMGHKIAAIYYGAYARFQMWVQGLVFMIITSLLGVLFAAPGAVYIYAPNIGKRENGLISLSGPFVNFLIMLVFFAMSFVMPLYLGGYFSFNLKPLVQILGIDRFEVWRFGAYINFILCMFNMLPVFPLDGSKIFGWSKLAWVSFLVMIFVVGVVIGLIDIGFAILWLVLLVFFSTISTLLFGRRR
jgi:Zn-dependent protease